MSLYRLIINSIFMLSLLVLSYASLSDANDAYSVITFYDTRSISAYHANGTPDFSPQDIDYCVHHNPLKGQSITIIYPSSYYKLGVAVVTSLKGQPILNPLGIAKVWSFGAGAPVEHISFMVFNIDNNTKKNQVSWITHPNTIFSCQYISEKK